MLTDPVRWARIRHRILVDGESIRGTVKSEQLSRKTIRKILQHDVPQPYVRAKKTTALTKHEGTISDWLAADQGLPQRERRTVADIFRSLRDDRGYSGGYSSVSRYCRSVRVRQVELLIKPFGTAETIDGVAIQKGPRTYRLDAQASNQPANILLRLKRDRRSERAAEVSDWINRLRGDRLKVAPRGDPAIVAHLLTAVHDHRRRRRNRAVAVLAYEQGFPKRRISACIGISRNTLRRYLQLHREGGVEKLLAPMSRGIKKADREDLKAAVFRILHEPPRDHGFNRTSWIMPDLRAALAAQGLSIGFHSLRKIIHDAGWKWRKARIVLTSKDPAYREKLAAVQVILATLAPDEAFFSIDEFGPFAVKMKQGLKLDPPGPHRQVPQWQKSKGRLIMTAALELSGNQVTHFYSPRKDTAEMIRMMELLLERYPDRRTLYLSWDAASWHVSKELKRRIEEHNQGAEALGRPRVRTAPLPAGAQFLNVIESIFSGMARAVIHNSDYPSAEAARSAIDRYFADRNAKFEAHPERAGKRIWGKERVPPVFSDSNNCKDPRWR